MCCLTYKSNTKVSTRGVCTHYRKPYRLHSSSKNVPRLLKGDSKGHRKSSGFAAPIRHLDQEVLFTDKCLCQWIKLDRSAVRVSQAFWPGLNIQQVIRYCVMCYWHQMDIWGFNVKFMALSNVIHHQVYSTSALPILNTPVWGAVHLLIQKLEPLLENQFLLPLSWTNKQIK